MASVYLIEDQIATVFVEILSEPEVAQYLAIQKILRYFNKKFI